MATGKINDWRKPEKLTLIQGWKRDGLKNEQIARNIGVSCGTFNNWCSQYSDIREAVKKGEEVCLYEVENALYKAAIGYDVTETEQIITESPDGSQIVQKRAKKRHIPPQLGAICFILKNRKISRWKDNPLVVDNSALDKLDSILKEAREAAKANAVQQETE